MQNVRSVAMDSHHGATHLGKMLRAWEEITLGHAGVRVVHPHLIVVEEGVADEAGAHLGTGRLYVRDGAETHLTAIGAPFRAVAVSIDGPPLGALHELFGRRARTDVCASALRGLIDRLRFEVRQNGPDAATLVDALLLELIALAARMARRPAPELEQLDRLFVAPERYRTLSPCDVASEIGVSPAAFAAACRRVFGVTPAVFLRDLRLGHAARALAQGDAPIADIAVECGFYDQSHLTNAFRSRHGMTPLQFRRCAAERRNAPSACETKV